MGVFVNPIGSVEETVKDGVDLLYQAGQAAYDTGYAIGEGSKAIGSAVTDAAKSSFDSVVNLGADAADSVKNTASGIGDALANIGKTAEAFQSLALLAFIAFAIYMFAKFGDEIVGSVLEL